MLAAHAASSCFIVPVYRARLDTFAVDPPPVKWLFVEFGGLGCEEEAATQQVELGPAVHGALEQLQAVDLPLVLPAAPG